MAPPKDETCIDGIESSLRKALGATFETVDLTSFELAYSPVAGAVSCVASPDGRRVSVHYVADDPYPPTDFWDRSHGRGEMHFGIAAEAKAILCAARGLPSFGFDGTRLVDVTEPSPGLYVPPAFLVAALRAGTVDRAGAIAECSGTVRSYLAWKEGSLCGVVSETFRIDADGALEPIHMDADWPAFDLERAVHLRDLRATDTFRVPESAPSFGP